MTDPREKIAKSAVVMANELRAHAIMVLTRRGSMARYISWMRPRHSVIYTVGEDPETARQLALNYGLFSLVVKFDHQDMEKNIELALKTLLEKRLLRKGNTVVVVSSVPAGDQIVDAVQMRVV